MSGIFSENDDEPAMPDVHQPRMPKDRIGVEAAGKGSDRTATLLDHLLTPGHRVNARGICHPFFQPIRNLRRQIFGRLGRARSNDAWSVKRRVAGGLISARPAWPMAAAVDASSRGDLHVGKAIFSHWRHAF